MDRLPFVKLSLLARQLGVSRKVLLRQLRALDRELHGLVLHQSHKHGHMLVNVAAAELLRNRLYRNLSDRVTDIEADIRVLTEELNTLKAQRNLGDAA